MHIFLKYTKMHIFLKYTKVSSKLASHLPFFTFYFQLPELEEAHKIYYDALTKVWLQI